MSFILSTILLSLSKVTHFSPGLDATPSEIAKPNFEFTAFGECDAYFYIGTNHGLFQKNKQNGQIKFLTNENSNLPNNHVTSIACTRAGCAFIGTQKGILIWDKQSFHLMNIQSINFSCLNITALAVDRNEDVWIGSPSAGLVKSTGGIKKLLNIHPVQTCDKNIYSITIDPKGCVWVAFRNGIIEYFQQGQSNTNSTIQSLEEVQFNEVDTFLLHTYTHGALLTDGSSCKNITIDPSCHKITCSYYNPKYSRMILCNEKGVHVFDIRDPLSGYRSMRFSEFIQSISCRGHDQKITNIITQIQEFEKYPIMQ